MHHHLGEYVPWSKVAILGMVIPLLITTNPWSFSSHYLQESSRKEPSLHQNCLHHPNKSSPQMHLTTIKFALIDSLKLLGKSKSPWNFALLPPKTKPACLPTNHFQVRTVSFRGCKSFWGWIPTSISDGFVTLGCGWKKWKTNTYVPGSINSHYFHIIGDGHQPKSVGVYIPVSIGWFQFFLNTLDIQTPFQEVFEPPNISWGSAFRGSKHRSSLGMTGGL